MTKCDSRILTAAMARNVLKDFWLCHIEWQCDAIALNYLTSARCSFDPCRAWSCRLEVFSVFFGRNNGLYATAQKSVPNVVAIITLISEQQSGLFHANGHQVFNRIVIPSLRTCEDEAKRVFLTVCKGVDFCRKAAA